MPDTVLSHVPASRVARGGVVAFIIYGVGIGMTYFAQLLIARLIGVEQYGVYAYVLAWMTVLAYFSALGFDVAVLRFLPAYEAEGKWSLFRGVIQYIERRAAIIGASFILMGAGVVVSRDLSPQLRNTFLIGLLLVPILALLWIRCATVRAFGGVVSAVAPDRVVRDGALVGLIVIAGLGFGWRLNAPTVMVATVMGALMSLCLATLAMHQMHPCAMDNVRAAYDAAAWRRVAMPLVIIGTTEALLNRTGVILLGWFGDSKAAGIYSLAFNIAFVVALPRIAINTLFAPMISSLFSRNDQSQLRALITSAASWTLAGAVCIAFPLFVFAEDFISWFGPGYEAGVPALRILLLGQLMIAGAGSQLYVMTMTGLERGAAILLVSNSVLNAVASATLISLLGLTGAAIAAATTLIVWNLTMALYLWRHLRLLPGIFANHHRDACSAGEPDGKRESASFQKPRWIPVDAAARCRRMRPDPEKHSNPLDNQIVAASPRTPRGSAYCGEMDAR